MLIEQETAARIWQCYREIHAAKKLLEDMAKAKEDFPYDPHERYLRDSFGRRQNLQLGIPSGESAHRLFDVSPDLAASVIKTHIANKEAELVEATEQAKIEFSRVTSDN